jgi:hypothetical protein
MSSLGRMFDRIFFGGGRSDEVSVHDTQTGQLARPSVEDRARYDSGTSVYYH